MTEALGRKEEIKEETKEEINSPQPGQVQWITMANVSSKEPVGDS